MNRQQMTKAFNEWMRRYIENPSEFEAEFNAVIAHKADEEDGREPGYGERCALYMEHLCEEVAA